MLEDKIQKPDDYMFLIFLGSSLWIKEVGDGRFIGRINILAIDFWK